MNSVMIAFGLASIMLCLGTLLRGRVPFFRNILAPASVIGGLLGCALMNVAGPLGINLGADYSLFSNIVNQLFTISFISIALTSVPKTGDNGAKHVLQGAVGMGLVWNILYALTPLIGAVLIYFIGKSFQMDAIYGMLIPFAFAQGPGQAATFGAIYEAYGWTNAAMVALTFAAVGFLIAFAVGIPAAKLGIKRGIAKHCDKIDAHVARGYYHKDEQTDMTVRDTTFSGNIETLSLHFAVIGLCYILAVGISKLFSLIPGFFGTSMSSMMFMNGMFAGYIVKFLMKKLKIDFVLDNVQQTKITNWATDYLIVFAFMAVSFQVLGHWTAPVLIESALMAVVTFAICFFFGRRFGGSNDFERTLGLFGTGTGTVPSGISLVRIVDPQFRTTTTVELGLMNLVMMTSTPVYLVLLAFASGAMALTPALLSLGGLTIVYAVLMKVTRTWKKTPSYSWKAAESEPEETAAVPEAEAE
jgi:ESS family glutamate:Na+ symporter